MECGIMHFGEFNPLDVLAAAASLQGPGQGQGTDNSQSDGDGDGDGEETTEDGLGSDDHHSTPASGDQNSCEQSPYKDTSTVTGESLCQAPPTGLVTASGDDGKAMPRVVKVLSNNGRLTDKLVTNDKLELLPKDSDTMTGTSTAGAKDCTAKTVTILRVKKTQIVDHSYAVYSKAERSRMEDDEGYCSRSSLGSPGQCWKSDTEVMDTDVFDARDSDCGSKSPYLVLPSGQQVRAIECLSPLATSGYPDVSSTCSKTVANTVLKTGGPTVPLCQSSTTDGTANRKCTKIVIVSRDANLRKYFGGDVEQVSTDLGKSAGHDNGQPVECGTEPKKTPEQDSDKTICDTSAEGEVLRKDNGTMEDQIHGCTDCSVIDSNKVRMRKNSCDMTASSPGMEQNSSVAPNETYLDSDNNSTEQRDGKGSPSPSAEEVDSTCDCTVEGNNPDLVDITKTDLVTHVCLPSKVMSLPEMTDKGEVGLRNSEQEHSAASMNLLTSEDDCQSETTNCITSASTLKSAADDVGLVIQREPSAEHKGVPDTIAGTTILSPSEQIRQQNSCSEVLHHLLASSSGKMDQTVLPSGEQADTPQLASQEKGRDNLTSQSSSTPASSAPSKASLVYIMSSTASGVTASTLATSVNSMTNDTRMKQTHSNKYIIQDDVPPVSKYGDTVSYLRTNPLPSPPVSTCDVSELNAKLSVTQPKLVAGSKDGFVLLRLGGMSSKPAKSSIVALNQATMDSKTTSCTVPMLVNGGIPLSSSILSSPAKGGFMFGSKSASSVYISPACLTKSSTVHPSGILKKNELGIKDELASASVTSLPQCLSSLLSSHKLLPCGSLIAMQPLLSSQEGQLNKNDDTLDTSSKSQMDVDRNTNNCDLFGGNMISTATPSQESGHSILSGLGQISSQYEGRMTPLGYATKVSDPVEAGGGNINIKISGGVVVDVQQEKGVRDLKNKASCCIGQVGSLTWQNVTPGGANTLESATNQSRLTSVQHGRKGLSGRAKKEGLSEALLIELKKKRPKVRAGMPSRAELYRMKECAQNISELHPLIDHDYCMFTEFSADIQSSIIATMDTKVKPERRSMKKTKAARTKLYQPPLVQAKIDSKLKKRKYTKRKLSQLLERVKSTNSDMMDQADNMDGNTTTPSVFMSGSLKEKLRDRKPKRHYRPRNSGDKNYVKIPGSYQDEFVYYATKKQRGRPRKFEEEHQESAAKPGIMSINEFEWYREMAKIDKGSKFGVAGIGMNNTAKPNSLELLHKIPDYRHDATSNTPIQESDVVDMVIDMMPASGLDVTSAMDSNKIFGNLMNNTVEEGENLPNHGHGEGSNKQDMATGSQQQNVEATGSVDPGVMAEFNRLLNSMEEAEQLKMLANLTESQTAGDKSDKDRDEVIKADGDGMLNNLNDYLGSYAADSHTTGSVLSVGQNQSQFLDLDDINDNDLLNTSELGNIFGDLTTAGVTATTTSLAVMSAAGDGSQKMATSELTNFGDSSCSSFSMESSTLDMPHVETQLQGIDPRLGFSSGSSAFSKPLDKRELFPDISGAVPQVSSEFGVPDLTLVNMYWNELPGLLINGKEYVRLVDIHKQVLPAKDTGILKKRCQMMGLEIMNCSELQRDFLIRYMNAAKSKSCVIVAKETAKMLIGFYVDPRPRLLNKQPVEGCMSTKSKTGQSKLKVLLPFRKESKADLNVTGVSLTSNNITDHTSSTSTNVVGGVSKSAKQKSNSRHSSLIGDLSVIRRASEGRVRAESTLKDIKRSPRLKNKKVMYAALHNGGWAEEESSDVTGCSDDKDGFNVELRLGDSNKSSDVTSKVGVDRQETQNDDVEMVALRRASSVDEIQLSELMMRQRECKLNARERRRIRKLQKKIRKRELKSRQHHYEKWLNNLEKAKCRRLEKKSVTDKYSVEHCYAASLEPSENTTKSLKLNDETDRQQSVENNKVNNVQASDQSSCKTVKHSGNMTTASKYKRPCVRCAGVSNPEVEQTLQVIHMDSVQRSHSQKTHSQRGTLHLSNYQSREAACIACNTCHEMLSVRRFLKHRHHLNSPDELVEVSLPQKLELCTPVQADVRSDDVQLWVQFTQRRQTFSQLLQKRHHHSKVKALPRHRPVVHRMRSASRKQLPSLPSRVKHSADGGRVGNRQGASLCDGQVSTGSSMPDDLSRHSGRVRKRKQLYPMESYVFGRSLAQASPTVKRTRRGSIQVTSDASL